VLRIFESRLNIDPLAVNGFETQLHGGPVGDDIEVPLLEGGDFPLSLTDDDFDDGALQPDSLRLQFIALLQEKLAGIIILAAINGNIRRDQFLTGLRQLFLPARHDQLVHPGTSNLVDTDQHRFARLPASAGMFDKVVGQLLQNIVSSDNLVILTQQLLQQGGLIFIKLGLFHGIGNPVVQIQPGNAQFLSPAFVDQLDRSAVLFGAFEVIGRNIAAEDPFGQIIVLEERRAGKADEGGIWERQAHVAGQLASLGAVRFVGDNDDVIPYAVRLFRVDVLVEFVDQAEDVAVVL